MKTLCCSRNVCRFSLSCYLITFWMIHCESFVQCVCVGDEQIDEMIPDKLTLDFID